MNYLKEVLNEVEKSVRLNKDFNDFENYINGNANIYLSGKGRSGIVVQGFANRLMHLGYKVHLVGEISAPHTKKDDILILCSGSGETKSLIPIAEQAKENNMTILLFTQSNQSTLAKLANKTFLVKTIEDSVQPMGTLFEELTFLIFDSIILHLMKNSQQDEQDMKARHADLE